MNSRFILSIVPAMLKYTFFIKGLIICFIASLFVFSGCDKFDGDQTIPAYLHIDSISLKDNVEIFEGSLSHKIVDAWVYVDDILIGAFELPATIPILHQGKHTVKIAPGIKMNGIANTRISYPFFDIIKIENVMFTPDSITKIGQNLTVSNYSTATSFPYKEDFEDGGITFQKSNGSDTTIIKTNGPGQVFEGGFSGGIFLDNTQSFFEIQTINTITLPHSGTPVFLEMNYKTNNPLRIGLYVYYSSSTTQQIPIIVLNPTNGKWNKVYINLTPTLNSTTTATSYRLWMGEYKKNGDTPLEVYIDNLKIVHPKVSK